MIRMHACAKKLSAAQTRSERHSLARFTTTCRIAASISLLSLSTRPIGLEAGIEIPQHSFPWGATFQSRLPFPAEADLVDPMAKSESWNQHGKRQERCGPRLVHKK